MRGSPERRIFFPGARGRGGPSPGNSVPFLFFVVFLAVFSFGVDGLVIVLVIVIVLDPSQEDPSREDFSSICYRKFMKFRNFLIKRGGTIFWPKKRRIPSRGSGYGAWA